MAIIFRCMLDTGWSFSDVLKRFARPSILDTVVRALASLCFKIFESLAFTPVFKKKCVHVLI